MNPNEVLYLRPTPNGTLMVTEQQTLHIQENAQDYLAGWCLALGSSLRGSADVVRHHLDVKQKLPVLVDPTDRLLFFPTLSKEHPECVWINYAKIRKLKALTTGTLVIFGQRELEVDIGIRSIRMQVRRCEKLVKSIGQTPYTMKKMKIGVE